MDTSTGGEKREGDFEDIQPHKQLQLSSLDKVHEEIQTLSLVCGICEKKPVHITEVFSPGSFTTRASAFRLGPGVAMDLRTGWDFNLESHRQAAFKYQETYKPWIIIGSPKCSFASTLQRLNRDTPEWRKALREGMQHLIFVCELYRRQIEAGRKFLHEHPRYAASWDLYMVKEIAAMEGVMVVDGDQCCFGQWGTDNILSLIHI